MTCMSASTKASKFGLPVSFQSLEFTDAHSASRDTNNSWTITYFVTWYS